MSKMSANPTDKSTNRRPRFTASKTLFNTEFHEKHIIVINCLSALLSILQQVHFLELNSNQIKSNLFANTKYERKKTDRKPEVKQNVKNNDKLEC